MMSEVPVWAQLLAVAAVPAFSAGAAWMGVRASLNGTQKRVERIETTVDGIRDDVTDVRERVARLEGR